MLKISSILKSNVFFQTDVRIDSIFCCQDLKTLQRACDLLGVLTTAKETSLFRKHQS